MKGYKTLIINAALALAAGGLPALAQIDLSLYLSPTTAVIGLAVINAGLRLVTTTAVGEKY